MDIKAGSTSLPHVIFLHGLFGQKEDWIPLFEHLKEHIHCIAIDLPKSNVVQHLKEQLPADAYLVGYSLGGRIALQLPCKDKILISSHLGILSIQEREQRKKWQGEWLEHFETLPSALFFRKWYTQPLFSSLSSELRETLIAKRSLTNPKEFLPLFLECSLLNQPLYSPQKLIFGKKDSKYCKMYRNFLDAEGVEDSGHICHLENPKGCANAIKRHLYASF